MVKTYNQLLEDYKRYLKYSGKSERTIYLYVKRVEDFLKYIGKQVDKIDRQDIMRYYEYLEKAKKYSNRSMYAVGWALRSFFQMIGKHEVAMWIPTPSFTVIREPEWIPEDKIMCVIDHDPVLCVAYDLALRLREITLLRVENYNPETGEIEVYRLKKKGQPMAQILVLGGTEPKTHCREVLNAYLNSIGNPRKGKLFNISDRAIQYRFKKRLEMCGLDPNQYTFHSLRHSRLTHMAIYQLRSKGYVDIVSLAKFAGHSRPDTTMMYVHLAHKYLSFRTKK